LADGIVNIEAMTWVVGAASMRGIAFLVADVRVVWGDGRSAEAIEKVHRVGNHVIAGFAGSVRLGFALIERLKVELGALDANEAWDLEMIGRTRLPRVLRNAYDRSNPSNVERKLGVQLLIGAVDGQLKAGLPEAVAIAFAKSRMCKIQSPTFRVEWATPERGMTIGSGAIAYASRIEGLLPQLPGMRSVTGEPQGLAVMLAMDMNQTIELEPNLRVSPYLHAAGAVWGASGVAPVPIGSGNLPPPPFPRTAETYEEFRVLWAELGFPRRARAPTLRWDVVPLPYDVDPRPWIPKGNAQRQRVAPPPPILPWPMFVELARLFPGRSSRSWA
jgi:hypothetical protein